MRYIVFTLFAAGLWLSQIPSYGADVSFAPSSDSKFLNPEIKNRSLFVEVHNTGTQPIMWKKVRCDFFLEGSPTGVRKSMVEDIAPGSKAILDLYIGRSLKYSSVNCREAGAARRR